MSEAKRITTDGKCPQCGKLDWVKDLKVVKYDRLDSDKILEVLK